MSNSADKTKEEREQYESAAALGDPLAQCKLGEIYYEGRGVPRNQRRAFEWFEKAARQGLCHAQTQLAHMYSGGWGVSQDEAKAAGWYEKAASQENADYQYGLGRRFLFGEGVPADPTKALEWITKAAVRGHVQAHSQLGSIYSMGVGIEKDDAKAAEWYQKAADQGHEGAQYRIGVMFAKGEGVPRDVVKAAYWLEKAALQGFSPAQAELGDMYAKGIGVPKDEAKASEWYEKGAAGGSPSDNYVPRNIGRSVESDQKLGILENAFEIYYHRFPTEHIFEPAKILSHGISEEVYEEVRRGHASLMAGLEAGGAWFRSGCVPLIFVLSIIGIPFLLFFVWSDGMMRRRARNAAILAFRSAAQSDPDYKKFLNGNLLSITTQHFDSVF